MSPSPPPRLPVSTGAPGGTRAGWPGPVLTRERFDRSLVADLVRTRGSGRTIVARWSAGSLNRISCLGGDVRVFSRTEFHD
jgi:hypothetical protein